MIVVLPKAEVISPKDYAESTQLLKTAELAGRNCYQSSDKITDASYERFIKMLLNKNHLSVLEFIPITMRLLTSRDVMAELTRHRIAGFAIKSQRYVCENDKDGGIRFVRPAFAADPTKEREYFQWSVAMKSAETFYKNLINMGMTNEDARKVLPNSTATEIFMTCNAREMRHILSLRLSNTAYPEMRQLASLMLLELQSRFPIIFDDFQ